MIIREYRESDQKAVEEIFSLYWTDPEFIKELSDELQSYIRKNSDKDLGFFVAEENGEIVGIAGFKKIADYLKPYTLTDKPIELYVIAAKYKREGIGEKLKSKLIGEADELGYSEMLLFSPNSHDESWGFHDKLGFERAGEVTPPEDEIGQVWRKVL